MNPEITDRTNINNTLEQKKESWWDVLRFIFITLAIVVPIRLFIAQPFVVDGSSMDSTFKNKDYLIVDELSYLFGSPHRGDVVVFHFPITPSKYLIKRLIGLPGDTVILNREDITIKNTLHPNGIKLSEPYVTHHSTDDKIIVVPEGQYFVMGDNRSNSYDSRAWGFVPKKNFVGRPLFRLFPIHSLDYLPGYFDQNLSK